MVVYHHGSHFHVFPLTTLFAPLYADGWRAVDFFFVLSGFVLARAYWTPGRKDRLFRNFWDRIGRLYPLHLVTLLFVALGQWYLMFGLNQSDYVYHINDGFHFLLNLFLVHGMDSSFNGPSWSISTEFVVNVLFFLIILLPRRLAFAAFILAIAFTFVPREGVLELATPFIRTLRGFCIGVLLHWAFVLIARRPYAWLPRVADVTFVLSFAGTIAYGYLLETDLDLSGGIILMLFCFMILAAPLSSLAAWGLNRAPLVYLGEISYSVYLVHFPLQLTLWLAYVTLGLTWPFGDLAGLVAFMVLTLACAALTYRYIEMPGKRLMRLRRKGYVDAIA